MNSEYQTSHPYPRILYKYHNLMGLYLSEIDKPVNENTIKHINPTIA